MLRKTVGYVKKESAEVRTVITWAVWSESAKADWQSVDGGG